MTGLPLAVVLLATLYGPAERGTFSPLIQQQRVSQEFHLVEQWRVGSDDVSIDRGFGWVSSFAVGPAQSVWVTDSHGPRLIRISAQGREMDEIGRVGSGPGEFNGNILVASYTHGRMAVRDTGNGRINIYGGDGSYEKTITGIGGGLQSVEQTFQTGPNGEIFLRTNDYTVPPPPQGNRPTR